MAFALSSSALIVGIICVVLVHRAPAANTKEDKNLRRLEQQNSAATTDTEDAAINTLRNLFLEEDRLLNYLGTADNGDYEPLIQKRRSISRRSCLRRGASCDARPNDCCESLACRCNLWGTNCRCQRAGLLQRLG